MEHTPNYNLKMPTYDEFSDVEDLNENSKIIDTELKKNANDISVHWADDINHVRYGTASGANAKTIALSPVPAILKEGMALSFKNITANTGAVTLNVNGLGAKPIVKSNGNALVSGNLKAGSIYTVRYSGTSFILQGEGGEYGNAVASDVYIGKTFGTDDGLVVGTNPYKSGSIVTENDISIFAAKSESMWNVNAESMVFGMFVDEQGDLYTIESYTTSSIRLRKRNFETGGLIWSVILNMPSSLTGYYLDFVVEGNAVYILIRTSARETHLIKYDFISRLPLINKTVSSNAYNGFGVNSRGLYVAYQIGAEGKVDKFDKETGDLVLTLPTEVQNPHCFGVDESFYVIAYATSNKFIAYKTDTTERLWESTLSYASGNTVKIVKRGNYFYILNNMMTLIDKRNGTPIKTVSMGSNFLFSDDDELYYVSGVNEVVVSATDKDLNKTKEIRLPKVLNPSAGLGVGTKSDYLYYYEHNAKTLSKVSEVTRYKLK